MDTLKFNYRNRQGRNIPVNIPAVEIADFEAGYKSKLQAKYGDSLISPYVEVVISADGSNILDVHTLANGKLE